MKILLIILLSPLYSISQGIEEYISKNAIEVDTNFVLDSKIYKQFENYELIMVGEMHGTNEPAKLVEALSELILKNEKTVSVGLEIPEVHMRTFLDNPSDSTLRQTTFFTRENTDGRNGEAWFNLISYCNSNPKINLFFFDNYNDMKIEPRDSAMYLSVCNQLKEFPDSKVITLSGSIHSWLIPFRDSPTMGNYLINDTTRFSLETVCSINHIYSEGTMLNNTGNGLELRTIEFQESVYSQSVNYPNYLLFYESVEPSQHNCFFYTRQVNHSPELMQLIKAKPH